MDLHFQKIGYLTFDVFFKKIQVSPNAMRIKKWEHNEKRTIAGYLQHKKPRCRMIVKIHSVSHILLHEIDINPSYTIKTKANL